MRLSVVKHEDSETVFYNPAIFREDEDLIIFPFKEFDKFYNETVSSLNVVKNMIRDSLNSGAANNTPSTLEHIEDWINLIQEDMDFLIQFDTQTTLNSFNRKSNKGKALKNEINSVDNIHKEQIQCLMGLL